MARGVGDKGLQPIGSIAGGEVICELFHAIEDAGLVWVSQVAKVDAFSYALDRIEVKPKPMVDAWVAVKLHGCQRSVAAREILRSEDTVNDYMVSMKDLFPPGFLSALTRPRD